MSGYSSVHTGNILEGRRGHEVEGGREGKRRERRGACVP